MLAVDTSSPFIVYAGPQLCASAWKSAGGNDPPHAVLQTASAPGHADIFCLLYRRDTNTPHGTRTRIRRVEAFHSIHLYQRSIFFPNGPPGIRTQTSLIKSQVC